MKTVSRPVVTLDGSRIILGVHEENTTISLRLPPKETRTLIDALIGALRIAWFAQGRESVRMLLLDRKCIAQMFRFRLSGKVLRGRPTVRTYLLSRSSPIASSSRLIKGHGVTNLHDRTGYYLPGETHVALM